MSIVSLCVILIEVQDSGQILPSLTFVAPGYHEMNSRGEKKGEFVPVQANPSTLRGKRPPRNYTVETYSPISTTTTTTGDDKMESTSSKIPSATQIKEPNSSSSSGTSHPPEAENLPKSSSGSSVSASNDLTGTEVKSFFSGNPFVEVTKGVLHLFKENEKSILDKVYTGRSEMLVMLAVPTFMGCTDVLHFLAPFHRHLLQIKVIRDSNPNQYMVLLKFKDQEGADACYQETNGKSFNSFEDDHCHLAYVSRIETLKDSDGGCLPLSGHTELPTCPVCLERMDESVEGILTILCNHTFHSTCLSKWSDSSCPVCRYVQTPELVAGNQCSECSSSESLWICLICGHIGCGRYVHGHAYKHFLETQHCYAIQPDNNRVWDYIGDSFVHRLLQNKSDGKMVELSGRPHMRGGVEDKDDSTPGGEEKVDSMQMEFTYLLTSQLQSQRHYFEERLSSTEKDMKSRIDFLMGKMELIETDRQELEANLSNLQKEKVNLERKINQISQKLAKAAADLKEEKEFNKCLEQDQKGWKEKVIKLEKEHEEYVGAKTAEIVDLKEQLRDIMFFLESKEKIENSIYKDELVDGRVTVDESSIPSTSKKTRRKKK